MKESLPPTAAETAEAVLAKIDEMDIDEIKAKIPKLIYAGILQSAFILNSHLKNQDQKKKKEAASIFLDRLGQANFLKNIAALGAGEEKKNQHRPSTAEWGTEKDNAK
jgi:hypothetical protein